MTFRIQIHPPPTPSSVSCCNYWIIKNTTQGVKMWLFGIAGHFDHFSSPKTVSSHCCLMWSLCILLLIVCRFYSHMGSICCERERGCMKWYLMRLMHEMLSWHDHYTILTNRNGYCITNHWAWARVRLYAVGQCRVSDHWDYFSIPTGSKMVVP